ncbi:hypothetical protein HBHAL_1961 [Halobacillus halophilus DSM 2266]|uniref:Uncharacterized protein n=1 Tax=Halobacillus halophilus (strain ATCC 35676 / DSM 2266 / JCM 20832 / KCTC 3685 / LMG 17431 / NBRC 102448 / NCIMB 2269) TaxID=866895 RepID=I0JJK4_HALH3|nr:hypothetical protein [Halobacillus halophilus]CCG44322.1 hypothetical protein HBHAL_1961 [Halobacillus halophilus DSM 2266]
MRKAEMELRRMGKYSVKTPCEELVVSAIIIFVGLSGTQVPDRQF